MKFIVLFILIVRVQSAPSNHLYLPEDDVEILNIENFKRIVENSTNSWLIEFYAAWCGHCQKFSEPWKKFATEIASWRDMLRVGVVACSDEENTPICQEFEVAKYPTVRYFHQNYTLENGDLGDLVRVKSDYSVETIKKTVIEKLIEETKEDRGIYPNLSPYTQSDVTQLLSEVGNDVKFVFLIIEEFGKYLGAEVALDLHQTPNISIRYSLKNNTDLIKKIENFPSVVVVDRNKNIEIFTKSVTTKDELKEAIGAYLEEKGLKIIETIPDKLQNTNDSDSDPEEAAKTILRSHVKNMGDVIFQIDLEAALRYSLEQEVSAVKVIRNEQLQALIDFVKVIKKYFPFGYKNSDFINSLSYLLSKPEVEGSEIHNLVEKSENQTFSSPQKFLGCLGSTPRYRGYPCSLWRLFHFFTVNSLLANSENPKEVLDSMHGYVKHFFTCEHCSQHFQQMAIERNISSVETVEGSVFWLWEAHNEVNKRLKGDFTEDPEYPKNKFPTKFSCPECYDEDGEWRKSEVLKFLKRMYGKYGVRYIGSDTRVLFPGLD